MIYLFRRFFAFYIDSIIVIFILIVFYIISQLLGNISFYEIKNPSISYLLITNFIFTFLYSATCDFFAERTLGKNF